MSAHARDSLDPFALREDKCFHFAAGGVLAYRVIRDTAVVSGDPIAPPMRAPDVLSSFLAFARRRGWTVVVTGAADRHLAAYRRVGLHALQMGNEAVVDPRTFSLEGRRVRKVRQSVARMRRRGWTVEVLEARGLARVVADELEAIEREWRAARRRVVGFAMTLGRLWGATRTPTGSTCWRVTRTGELQAFLHFVRYRGGLSLDVMRRCGDEPNGLNEAMVVAAMERARAEGLAEVSLNFAGCAHLVAPEGRLTLRRVSHVRRSDSCTAASSSNDSCTSTTSSSRRGGRATCSAPAVPRFLARCCGCSRPRGMSARRPAGRSRRAGSRCRVPRPSP